MNLLIDTHALLWLVEDSPRLSERAAHAVAQPDADVFLSPASYWELAIKIGLGKLRLRDPLLPYLEEAVELYELTILPITFEHTAAVAELPQHHKDPFDRMLVAQATVEQMTLLSSDTALDAYGVSRAW